MQGRRSQDLAIIVYNPEIERTFRQQRRQAERVNGQKIEFKVFKAMKMPRDEDSFQIEVIEQAIGEVFPRAHGCKEELDTCIQQGLIKSEIVRDSDEFDATLMEIVNQLEVLPSIPSKYSNSYEILELPLDGGWIKLR
ncbi:hypothetical protein AAC387_Pa06g1709 [Persea americana]